MRVNITRHIAVTACLAVTLPAAAQTDITATMQHAGLTRSYIVHLPPGFSAAQRHPLVVALHPSFSSGASFQTSSGWDAVANAHRLVVVYPTGGSAAGSGGTFSWKSWEFSDAAPDDTGFLSALILRMHADYGTDPCRSFMTGFSNGAMMTNTFVASHAEQVAAIAPVSGGWITAYGGDESDLNPSGPMPVWIWRGSNENFSTGTGGTSLPRSAQDEAQREFWVRQNDGSLVSTSSEQLTYGLTRTYVTSTYAGNAPVWFTEVQGTSHQYQPGAADLIWNRFFSQIEGTSGSCGCPADLDGTGTIDGGDLALMLLQFGEGGPADLDRDGAVSAGDVALLLLDFGPCG